MNIYIYNPLSDSFDVAGAAISFVPVVSWGQLIGDIRTQTDLQAALSTKSNVALSPTAGHLGTLDSDGNVIDSGKVFSTDETLAGNSDNNIPTQKAVKAYTDQLLSVASALVYAGALDLAANPNYPAGTVGQVYTVSVAGKIGGASGIALVVGNLVICKVTNGGGDQGSVGFDWDTVSTNIAGTVLGPNSAISGDIVLFNGTTGGIIKDSGLSISTDGTLAADSDLLLATQKAIKTYIASSLAVAGVASFNTRIGAIILTSTDVATALGYTPVSPGTIADSGVSISTDGTLTANSDLLIATQKAIKTYIASVLAIAGVSSFNSRSGPVSLESVDVTTALGYTPATTDAVSIAALAASTAESTAVAVSTVASEALSSVATASSAAVIADSKAVSVGTIASTAESTAVIAQSEANNVVEALSSIITTWAHTSVPAIFPNGQWNVVAISSDGSHIVVGDASEVYGVYFSINGGNSWAQTSLPTAGIWDALAMSSNGLIIVAADSSEVYGVYLSTNGGTSWTQQAGVPTAGHWISAAISSDGSHIAVCDLNSTYGVYVTTNGGTTWTQTSVPTAGAWYTIAMSSDGSKIVTGDIDSTYGVYLSTNGGTTWVQTSCPTGGHYCSVAISSDGSHILALDIANNNGVYLSTNSGTTWSQTGVPTGAQWSGVAISLDGSHILVVDASGVYGAYLSTNGGTSWTQQTGVPTGGRYFGGGMSSDGSKIVVTDTYNSNGTYLSVDGGIKWVLQVAIPLADQVSSGIAISSDGSHIVLGDSNATYGVYVATFALGLASISTDGTLTANSDSNIPTQKAVKTYAQPLIAQQTTSGAASIEITGIAVPILQDDTFDGYTLAQVVKALRTQGLLA